MRRVRRKALHLHRSKGMEAAWQPVTRRKPRRGAPRPAAAQQPTLITQEWRCGRPNCLGRNAYAMEQCRDCGKSRGPASSWREPEWHCVHCRAPNYLQRKSCRKCNEPSGLSEQPAGPVVQPPGLPGQGAAGVQAQRAPRDAARRSLSRPPLDKAPTVTVTGRGQSAQAPAGQKAAASDDEDELQRAIAALDGMGGPGVDTAKQGLVARLEELRALRARRPPAARVDAARSRVAKLENQVHRVDEASQQLAIRREALVTDLEAARAELQEAVNQLPARALTDPAAAIAKLLEDLAQFAASVTEPVEPAALVQRISQLTTSVGEGRFTGLLGVPAATAAPKPPTVAGLHRAPSPVHSPQAAKKAKPAGPDMDSEEADLVEMVVAADVAAARRLADESLFAPQCAAAASASEAMGE